MPSSRSERTSSHAFRRAAGSKPVVGSSRKTRSGSPTSAMPRSSRRFCPPESVFTRVVALLREADELDHLVDGARPRVVAGEDAVHLAHGQLRPELRRWSTTPIRSRNARLHAARVEAEHLDLAGVAVAVALEDLDGRRLAGAVRAEQAEDLAGARPRSRRRGRPRPRCSACAGRGRRWRCTYLPDRLYVSTRYVNSQPDRTRDPRPPGLRRPDGLRHQAGHRPLDPVLLGRQLRANLSRAAPAGGGRARPLARRAARRGAPARLRASRRRARRASTSGSRQPGAYELRDEGLLQALLRRARSPPTQLAELVRRRREWYEQSRGDVPRLGEDLGAARRPERRRAPTTGSS